MVSEKYGYMMASTHPEEFRQIEYLLPPVDPVKKQKCQRIISRMMDWERALAQRYPTLTSRGRVLYTEDDTPDRTSIETYLRGELYTYPDYLLEAYIDYIQDLSAAGAAGIPEMILKNTVGCYGFDSLESAERKLSGQAGEIRSSGGHSDEKREGSL